MALRVGQILEAHFCTSCQTAFHSFRGSTVSMALQSDVKRIKCINHRKVSEILTSVISNKKHYIINNSYTQDFFIKKIKMLRYLHEICPV